MKKLLPIFLFASIIYSSITTPAYALFGVGDIVFDPTMSIKQGLQYVSELATQASTYATMANTYLTSVNDTVLKPLRDALTIAAIVTTGNNIQNLILGSLGNEALLITDPKAYIIGKGNSSIVANLGTVSSQKGVYSDSILNSIINSTRANSNTNTKLVNLTQSSVPSIVQNNICTDTSLNQLTSQDLGSYASDASLFANRKKEISDAYCAGDPKTDPALAQKLLRINQQSPSLGGWDSWLATTGGDNQYSAATRAQIEIDKQAEAEKAAATQDLAQGGGIKSQTNCDQTATPVEGVSSISSTLPCVRETIRNTSATLKAAWDDAIGSPLRTLQSSLTGSASIVGTAYQTISLLNGINSSLNTTVSNINGTGSNTSNQTTTSAPSTFVYSGTTQPNTSVTTSQTYTQDLANNPTIKETLVNPITKLLRSILDSIVILGTIDQKYISEINIYESSLSSLNSCYSGLNSPDTSAINFYNSKKPATDALLANITNELNSLPNATNITNNTLSAIQSSNSTQQITDLFNNYQNQVDAKIIPSITTRITRESEYETFKTSSEIDLGVNGTLSNLINQCNSLRQQQLSI